MAAFNTSKLRNLINDVKYHIITIPLCFLDVLTKYSKIYLTFETVNKTMRIKGILLLFIFSSFVNIKAQQLTFAFLTDLHVSPGSENEKALNIVVDDINNSSYDIVIVTGDLTNTGSNKELIAVKHLLDKLNKPLLIIPGNHETNWSESAGIMFNELWGNDRFIYNINGFSLIGYNTGPFMKMGDGHVKKEDIQWLKRILKQNNSQVISFSHYPLSDELDNWKEITRTLKANNCILSFCGHGHKLNLFNFDSIPGIMGRALSDKKGFGYNIVEINGNRVRVNERLINTNIQPSSISLDFSAKKQLDKLSISPSPDFSVNNHSNARVEFELTDTASIFTGPCLSGDSLVIYCNSAGWIKAIKIETKTILWEKHYLGPIYSTPVIVSGKVIFGSIDGFIRGLNLKTGDEDWSVKVDRPVIAEGLSEKNYIYLGGGDKAFYKINAENGDIIWSYNGISGTIQGKPALSGKYIVFGAWDTNLYCLEKNTGNLLWKWNNGKEQRLFSPGNIVPAISHNKVFIVAPDRFFTAIDIKTGKEIWRTNKYRVRESMGMSADGKYIYAKLMNDSIICISALSKKFKTTWAINVGYGYDHNPCPLTNSGKTVFGATKNGLIVAINQKKQTVEWKYKVGNASINKLVVDPENRLWLTSTEGLIISLTHKL